MLRAAVRRDRRRRRPTPEVLAALADAEAIVIAPSNPLVSVAPILDVPGLRDAIAAARARGVPVAAVSPIIGGKALKGPADRMLAALGHESSAARRRPPVRRTWSTSSCSTRRMPTLAPARRGAGPPPGRHRHDHARRRVPRPARGRGPGGRRRLTSASIVLVQQPEPADPVRERRDPRPLVRGREVAAGRRPRRGGAARARRAAARPHDRRGARDARGVAEVLVVSPDPDVLRVAEAAGARPLEQRSRGLNPPSTRPARPRPARRLLILPADIPASPRPRSSACSTRRRRDRPAVGRPRPGPPRRAGRTRCCSTRRTSSTPRSAATAAPATRWLAASADAPFAEVRDVLAPRHRHARGPAARRGNRARGPRMSTERRRRVEVDRARRPAEIHEGDDLEADDRRRARGDARGAPRSSRGDVLVVTQKVVSKAEGAVVDLRTVEPSPRGDRVGATLGPRRAPDRGRPARGEPDRAHGARRAHHRDAARLRVRQRRRRRVQRRPGLGRRVTLLPRRPGRVRCAHPGGASATGSARTSPVIISDSFGRPWRWGIVDVALGVSGPPPARGPARPARRGRPGRCARRSARSRTSSRRPPSSRWARPPAGPVALVRGASPPRGEGTSATSSCPRRTTCSADGAPAIRSAV